MSIHEKAGVPRLLHGHHLLSREKWLRANPVWSYDFFSVRTHEGRLLRMLALIDEYTRECLALRGGSETEQSGRDRDVVGRDAVARNPGAHSVAVTRRAWDCAPRHREPIALSRNRFHNSRS